MRRKPQHQYRYQQLRPKVLMRDNYVCQWCGVQLRRPGSDVGAPPHVDHVIPVTLGGAPFDMANMVASCEKCNLRKGRRLIGRRRGRRFLTGPDVHRPRQHFSPRRQKGRKPRSRAW